MTARLANRGKWWEVALSNWHRAYREARAAVMFRCHPHAKNVRGRIVYERKGGPDYSGALADGRAVAIEAKSSTGSRWQVSQIEHHQAKDLEAVMLAGGVAAVALRLPEGDFWLPWSTLGPVYWGDVPGPCHITAARAAELGTPIGPDGWLECV